MAISHPTAVRNILCDTAVDLVDTGGAGNIKIYTSGAVLLVTIPLSNPGFGAAASGTAALAGVPKTGTSVASGTADNFTIEDGAGTVRITGSSITATGGGGDLTLDTTSISAIGQTVTITGGGYTAPL